MSNRAAAGSLILSLLVAAGCARSAPGPGNATGHPPSSSAPSGTTAPAVVSSSSAPARGGQTSTTAPPLLNAPRTVQVHPVPGLPPDLGVVDFVNSEDGWVAGRGIILGTTDGGRTWTTEYTTDTGPVTALDFVDPQNGWAQVGNALLRTTDGGRQWTALPGVSGQPRFLSATVGYTTSGLSWTTDGGATWTRGTTPIPSQSTCFANADTGWIAGATAGPHPAVEVYATANGGGTWNRVLEQPIALGTGVELGCVAPGAVWLLEIGAAAAFQQSYTLYASDGGAHWTAVVESSGAGPAPGNPSGAASGPAGALGQLIVVNRQTAYLGGICQPCGGGLGIVTLGGTTDGGATWKNFPNIPRATPNGFALSFTTAQDGWAVDMPSTGESVLLGTTDGGQTWTIVHRWVQTVPDEAVSFPTATVGFGLGLRAHTGAVLGTTDGGQTWTELSALSGSVYSLNPLSFVSATLGWTAVGGHLFQTNDGGRRWTAVPAAGAVASVDFTDATDGCVRSVAQPKTTTYLGTTDGGSTWSLASGSWRGVVACAQALAGSSVVGGAARLVTRVAPGQTDYSLLAVKGQEAWVSVNAQLYVTEDGGRSWTPIKHLVSVQSVSLGDPQHVWILTEGGRLFASADGGGTWNQLGAATGG